MAKKKLAPDALLRNAEKRIKDTLPKGEIGYATFDGQAFYKGATDAIRKKNAQNHAFNFKPPLSISKVEGEFEPKPKSKGK